jgi:hypothetical protein
LAYAEAGIPVFPVAMVEKTNGSYSKKPHPMLNRAPRGEGGYKLASADPKIVAGWWSSDPQAAIGWYPGAIELAVIDADGPSGIRDLYDASAGRLDNTTTLQVRTSGKGGGRLVLFDRTGIAGIIRNGSLSGVLGEARADRGYGMLPDGTGYYTFDSDTLEVAKLPKWAYEILPWSTNGDGRASIDDVSTEDEQRWIAAHTSEQHSRNGQALIDWCISKLEDSDTGVPETGRHPTMTSVVGKVLSHAQAASGRDLDLAAAFTELHAAYISRFDTEDERRQRSQGYARFWSDAVALRFKEGDPWDIPLDDDSGPDTPSAGGLEPDDLAAVAAAGLDPIEPDIFWRRDARALLYRGKLNVIFGAPEAGKTWAAIIAAAALINDAARTDKGVVVVFFDFEDDARSYLTRLQAAGCNLEDAIKHSDHYSLQRPVSSFPTDFQGVESADLIVVDTTNSAMVLDDLDPLSNKDALRFIGDIRRLRVHTTGAWLLLDHEPISTGAGRRQAIGAQSKLGAVDGAQYRAVAVEQPRPGARGAIALYLTKDRAGGVRQHAAKPDEHGIQHAATIFLNPLAASDRFTWELIEPQGVEGDSLLRTAILEVCVEWSAKSQIEQLVRGTGLKRRAVAIREMVEVLAAEGALEQAPRGNYVVYKRSEEGVVPSRDDRDEGGSSQSRTTDTPDDPTNVDTTRPKGSSDDLGTTGTTAPFSRSSESPPLGGTTKDDDPLPVPY